MSELPKKRRRHRKKSRSLVKSVQRAELKQVLPLLRSNRLLRLTVTLFLFLVGIAFTYYYVAPRIVGE